MFAIAIGLILAVVVFVLSVPFWSKDQNPMQVGYDLSEDQERIDLEVEKQVILSSLSELDVDLAQGKLAEADYQKLKATDERRLLQILNKLDRPDPDRPSYIRSEKQTPAPAPVMHWAGSVLLAVLVIG